MTAVSLRTPPRTGGGRGAGFPATGRATPRTGLVWMFGAEALSSVLGFATLMIVARRLGPTAFASLEYGAAGAAWLLVLVRGGFDVVVYREAARRPRLIGRLTNLLLGLRALAAIVGYGLLLALAVALEAERGAVVVVSGGVLLAAVGVTDVGPRVTGRLGVVALAQVLRSATNLGLACWLVRGSGDPLWAAGCQVAAELAGAVLLATSHALDWGIGRPQWRWRATIVLAHRGAIAGVTRFARVTLYGLDLLALGWWLGPGLGPYAAGRRVIYAILALGLVVPATLAPALAREWAISAAATRRLLSRALCWLWWLAMPTVVASFVFSDRILPGILGPEYRHDAWYLALVAARLPALLAAALAHSALTACRREFWSLRFTLAQTAVGLLVYPILALRGGPSAVGWAAVALEWAGLAAVWRALGRLDVCPAPSWPGRSIVAGCVVLAGVGWLTRAWPMPLSLLMAALSYGGVAGHSLRVERGGAGAESEANR